MAEGLLGGEAQPQGPMLMQEESNNMVDVSMAADSWPLLPLPEEQAFQIQQQEEKQIAAGEQLYIISNSWWSDWCAYTHFKQPADSSSEPDAESAPPPLEIDNSDIVGANGDLARDLEENKHFVIVTAQSWALLHGWYAGGPAITRPAVMEGLAPHTKRPRVMLYPMKLEVCWGGKPNEIKTMEAEKNETVRSLKERACVEFECDPAKTEIWDFFHNSKYAKLEDQLDRTLAEARILDDQPILLDDKANPLECENKSSSSGPVIAMSSRGGFGRSNSFMEDSTIQRSDGRAGLVGLQNLGNTCFMNSSLQCLMHSVPIMGVFLSGEYESDLNTANPLGMKGQLAAAFGSLISNLWRGEVGTVVPRGFKAKIAQFAPQFSGYQQHDSQEFLAFLLDGLHEDINRIQEKPYIEEADSEGVPDQELAAHAWANYRARNDSHIVDHFQGLYKSTLVCPQCSYSSVKFDPFMYLSLPLPESKVRQLAAILLHADGSAPPREYGVEVPQTGTVKDLYVALARVAGLSLTAPEQQMVAAKLTQRYSYSLSVFDDPKSRISELVGRDTNDGALLVYYYSQPQQGPAGEGNQKVLVYHRKAGSRRSSTEEKFSAPLLLWLPPAETYDPQLHVVSSTGITPQPSAASSSRFALGSTSSSTKDQEYTVTEDAPIWSHIKVMLQPFLAVPALRQQPPVQQQQQQEGAAGDCDGSPPTSMQQDQQEQQQPAASGGPADVSMAAASCMPGSPTASPDPCCTSRPQPHVPAGAGVGVAAGGVCSHSCAAHPDDDECTNNNRAASEAGENNSTWGSHGSDSPRSDMDQDQDLGGLDEPDGDAAAGAAGTAGAGDLPAAAAAGGDPAEAAAAAAVGPPDASSPLVQSEGELDTNAAFAMQELGSGLEAGGSPPAAAGQAGGALLGAAGVPVQPLDMWAPQTQQAAATPATTPPGSTSGEGASAAPAAGISSSSWPHYQLKLARDTGDFSTVVTPWYSAHFHPNAMHNTFVLDWDLNSCCEVTYQEYAVAAAAAVNAQQPQQHPSSSHQQQEPSQQQQQQPPDPQQQPDSSSSSSLGFWLPDTTGVTSEGSPVGAPGELNICGDYVVQPLQQPEFDASTIAIKAARADPRGKSVGLEGCVEAFLQPEQLSEADEWYCPKCKEHVQADKKLDLWSLPEVLVVHLKRFSYTRWNRDKLDTQVLFPLQQLDLSRYVLHAQDQPPIYDCFAVSNHYGGLGGGHYTAFAQMPNDKKWYCFDDSRVEEIAPEGVQSRAAYVLFYRRRQQVQADPPHLVDDLLAKRAAYLEQKRLAQQREQEELAAAAAAAATAAAGGLAGASPPAAAAAAGPATMEEDAPLVFGTDTGAAAAANSPADAWGSPAVGVPAGCRSSPIPAAGDDVAMGSSVPASPASVLPDLSGRVGTSAGVRAGAADTTSTSTSSHGGVQGGEEDADGDGDGDSSDGSSSSRPGRSSRRVQQAAWDSGVGGPADWAALPGVGDGSDWVSMQFVPMEEVGEAAAAAGRSAVRRPSDQDLDADMADRDA